MATDKSLRIVIATFGSFGDIHPYIPIALELKARGHRPLVITMAVYREKFEALGIEFASMRPDFGLPSESVHLLEKAMDAKSGTEFIFKEMLMPHIRASYDDLLAAAEGADLLMTHPITLAGPLVAAKTNVPWISSVLSPVSFFSMYDPPDVPVGALINRLFRSSPTLFKYTLSLMKLRLKSWVGPLYKLREELGLPAGGNPILEGQHSPDMVLALFSKVLAKPQPDWPAHTFVTGFPFYDRHDGSGISPELAAFLDSGEPPIVFTLGSSAVWTAEDFYHESLKAAIKLGRRTVLIKGEQAMDFPDLPENVFVADYVPYGEVFPKAAVIVHQGGVGTTAQALRSGVPMLVVPFSHDQPDNAARVVRLGVGETIPRTKYRADSAIPVLGKMLSNSQYGQRAREVARIMASENAAVTACDLIERYWSGLSEGEVSKVA